MTTFHELGNVKETSKVPNLFLLIQYHLLHTFFDLAKRFSWVKLKMKPEIRRFIRIWNDFLKTGYLKYVVISTTYKERIHKLRISEDKSTRVCRKEKKEREPTDFLFSTWTKQFKWRIAAMKCSQEKFSTWQSSRKHCLKETGCLPKPLGFSNHMFLPLH